VNPPWRVPVAWLFLAALLGLGYGLSWAAIAIETMQVYGVAIARARLLTDQGATTNGEWVDVSGLSQSTIHVSGITTATVEINGSNAATRPADNTHGIKLNATDITADQLVYLDLQVRWLKVRVPAYTSGTINAYFEGRFGS
jgi:hypothetical protein